MNNSKFTPFIRIKNRIKTLLLHKFKKQISLLQSFVFMRLINKYFTVIQHTILGIGLCLSLAVQSQDARFTVVLDAGHGGHDPGAMGSNMREKDINLAVTLDLGALLEQNFKDVKVVYTRKTDRYLTLQERADVVNDHHADLFICVHTNSSPSAAAWGAESYTLGLAKTKANLDVAMRENSVITLEENYKTKYQGFDPNSVDSYIMFEFMQDKYIDRSVDFASTIQKQFKSFCNRADRGVRQAGFWVLHRSACPSVLVEVGFISNPAEERYLSTESGQKEMARGVFNAFVDYKRAHDKKSGRQILNVSKIEPMPKVENLKEDINTKQSVESPQKNRNLTIEKQITETSNKQTINTNSKPLIDTVLKIVPTKNVPVISASTDLKDVEVQKSKTSEVRNNAVPVFKVQLFASKKAVKRNAADFKGLTNVDCYIENGMNKYTVGAETDFRKIELIRKQIHSKFPEAFVIAFLSDKKLSGKELSKISK
jgi:N-acetylmuramoyl-L-alanine amidase